MKSRQWRQKNQVLRHVRDAVQSQILSDTVVLRVWWAIKGTVLQYWPHVWTQTNTNKRGLNFHWVTPRGSKWILTDWDDNASDFLAVSYLFDELFPIRFRPECHLLPVDRGRSQAGSSRSARTCLERQSTFTFDKLHMMFERAQIFELSRMAGQGNVQASPKQIKTSMDSDFPASTCVQL